MFFVFNASYEFIKRICNNNKIFNEFTIINTNLKKKNEHYVQFET